MHLSKVRVCVVHSTDHVMHGVNSSNMSHSNVVDSSNMVDSGHGSVVYTSYMIDSMVDSRDNVVVVDSGVDRVDSTYMGNSSVVVHHGVSFSLSLTLAVQEVVVVEGMRVDSSYMLDSSMDNRSYRSYTVDRVDTSYMMDSRDMSVIDSSYSVANSSVVDQ